MKRWKGLAACLIAGLVAFGASHKGEAARHRVAAQEGDSSTIVERVHAILSSDPSYSVSMERGGETKNLTADRLAQKAGDAASNGALHYNQTTRNMHEWAVDVEDTGGTLLFSDSPEYVKDSGILYEDTVVGDARVLYYHLNDSESVKKVAVVLQNPSASPVTVTVTRGGTSDASTDYLEVGKNTQIAYFQTKRNDVITVPAHGKRLLEAEMDEAVLMPGQLVYGVYDFHAAAPVKASVICYPDWANPLSFLSHARVLPKDEQRLRGTFKGMDRVISSKPYDPERDGVVYISIGDSHRDTFRKGIDATDGSTVTDVGNYGVLYRLEIPSVGRVATQYYLTPLGGVYAGAMRVHYGQGKTRLLETPGGRAYFGDDIPPDSDADRALRLLGRDRLKASAEMSDLGSYHSTSAPRFEFSPPGASNLPVQIILMPAKQ